MLADQNAQSGAARAGFLQALELAHAHIGGELLALGDGAFRIGGAGGQRALHDIVRQFQQVILTQRWLPGSAFIIGHADTCSRSQGTSLSKLKWLSPYSAITNSMVSGAPAVRRAPLIAKNV